MTTTIRVPEGHSTRRDGKDGFSFDDVSYPCFALGSTWNGFDNVSISSETRDLMAQDWRGTTGFDPETLEEFEALPVDAEGRICLGWGYATQLDER